eukprot:474216-Pyramimonas_sp.AAC.1
MHQERVTSVAVGASESYEAWMRRMCAVAAAIEVNLNTGEVTVKSHHFQALPKATAIQPDVRAALGPGVENETCAEVARSDARHWLRLVGRQ